MAKRKEAQGQAALPPIAALFLVVFDQKVGYSLAWKQSIPGLQLEGVVEYKSLPSGLHNVQSDLIYFVHDQHAGVSAFVRKEADEEDRNAHFAAVGVLVPLSYGRLGRSWLHAQDLRDLANTAIDDTDNVAPLHEYWERHRMDQPIGGSNNDITGEASSPSEARSGHNGRKKRRTMSDATTLSADSHILSPDHPALTLLEDLDMFGPLLFPLHRAALLRKRILILTHTPVQKSCNLVYNLSVLANVPPHLADALELPDSVPSTRPMFNVGVHDITALLSDTEGAWLACSTDDILGTKTNMYDVLVELPTPSTIETGAKQWPQLRTSNGENIKATQRDLRRYRSLRRAMDKVQQKRNPKLRYRDSEDTEETSGPDADDNAPLLLRTDSQEDAQSDDYTSLEGERQIVEPMTWTAIAYTGFIWWASAGENKALSDDEASQDADLLEYLPFAESMQSPRSPSATRRKSEGPQVDERQEVAMVLIAYYHRLAELMLGTLAEVVLTSGNETERDDTEEAQVMVESEDIARMGLDVWSAADKDFVRELAILYFDQDVEVRRKVECCGLKIY